MINQQKIYIDIDEEITTVIDQLHQVQGNNIALVVPQHALLLQSVVNLKLLSREARKYNKNIVIMTQDEDGIAFATRAGIVTQPFVADTHSNVVKSQVVNPVHMDKNNNNSNTSNMPSNTTVQQRQSVSGMGSQSFDKSVSGQKHIVAGISARQVTSANQQTNVEQVNNYVDERAAHNNQMSSISQKEQSVNMHTKPSHQSNPVRAQQVNTVQKKEGDNFSEYEQTLSDARLSKAAEHSSNTKQTTNDYSAKNIKVDVNKDKKKKKQAKNIKMPKSTSSAMKGFVWGGIALVIIIISIIVLPKTTIDIEPKRIDIDESMEMTAKTDQDTYDGERRIIPARAIERDVTFTKTFDATGSGDVSAQNAQGTIKIFNEYSTKPQPLVATTRFLSEDGVLFRLVNAATVPGMNGDEPGSVEALVIADESGVIGNIEPSRFSIPGFDGSPKSDKFYATSDKSMSGGGTGGTGVTIVTAEDIARAKVEMTTEVAGYIVEQTTGLLRPENEVLTEEGIKYEEVRSEANVSEGTMTDQFMYEIVSNVKALVFSEDDVLGVMESNLAEEYSQYSEDDVNVELSYDNLDVDFENETIKMNTHGTAYVVATVDLDSFSQDILGKKHDDLLDIMNDSYSDEIEKITIDSVIPGFPAFIANRISRFEFMTNLFVR